MIKFYCWQVIIILDYKYYTSKIVSYATQNFIKLVRVKYSINCTYNYYTLVTSYYKGWEPKLSILFTIQLHVFY